MHKIVEKKKVKLPVSISSAELKRKAKEVLDRKPKV